MKRISILLSLIFVSMASFGFILMNKNKEVKFENVSEQEIVVKKEVHAEIQGAGI